MIGVCDATSSATNRSWQSANGWAYLGNGLKYTNNGSASYGASYTTNDVIGVALDMDAGTVTFYKNGASQGVAYSVFSGKTITPYLGSPSGSGGPSATATYNFGQRPFAYTAPSGYKALCTQNLPTPAIGATTATQAGKYFNAVTFTPTSYPAVTTGVGFQPDFTWWKNRVRAEGHVLWDVLRGSNLFLRSNTTAAEDTQTNGWVANSDGWTASSGSYSYNEAYVAWNWKANGSGSTNTSGSITSTVSANTTSGFSVVTYTGTGASASVGHGLGVAPSMYIVKCRSNGTTNWPTYHKSITAANVLFLNVTDAQAAYSDVFNATNPTSSVFSIGTSNDTNGSGRTYVAYCFAEISGYSKFGSYTGNGSSDGVFVYTGFRPAFVMVKSSTYTGTDWSITDTSRSPENVCSNILFPNLSDAENTGAGNIFMDIVSNGFKCRANYPNINSSGQTYIFMAFASNPFKTSLAR